MHFKMKCIAKASKARLDKVCIVKKLLAVSFMEVFEKAPAVDDSMVDIEAVSVNTSAAEAFAAVV